LGAAVDLADPRPDEVLLDVGTGTGGLLRELARRPDRPRIAIGVDGSAAMLERARALPQGWPLETGDARRLRFADGTFSVVTAAYLLHVVDAAARRQIIAEARRVLRPGGRFVVVTPTWPRTRLARTLYAPLAAAAGSSVGPRGAFRPLDPRAELEAASFTIAAARYVGCGYPSICFSTTRGA
jgi:ubiquinone/menaquinone biosynthesis C-methylase UbiE